MATYVVAEAATATSSFLACRLDSGILDSDIIVADTLDGAPLPKKRSFKIVALAKNARSLGPYARIHQRVRVQSKTIAEPWHAVEELKP